jgi:hypothetical protein
MNDVHIRPLLETERPFVLSSWLKSYRNAPAVRLADNATYYAGQAASILKTLDRAETLVAADPEDDNVIWGFIVSEGELIHYVYVKHLMRRNGLAHSLWCVAGKPTVATAMTHAGESILRAHSDVLAFDPYAVGERERYL